MIVLGIETSCDETAAAVVDGDGRVRAQAVLSQIAEHVPYGGIVPEVAARAHLAHLDRLIAKAMDDAKVGFADLAGVAATAGPGLIGGVIVGVMTAKAIAAVQKIPFLAVNHLEGHALTARFTDAVAFPYLLLLVSGGHCQLLVVEDVARYRRLGTTLDDAAGEAFDKVAKLVGLPYPGGPAIAQAARAGDPRRFDFPRPLKGKPGCNFSFSGLKTAVRLAVEALPAPLSGQDVADLAASFQTALVESVIDRTRRALRVFRADYPQGAAIVAAGGVAANSALRTGLVQLAAEHRTRFVAPPPALCTDNAVMIAWAGAERLKRGMTDPLDFKARPRWPLDPDAAPVRGAGVKA
jgi:N6-L-threonylcarbamoyladenine synthase